MPQSVPISDEVQKVFEKLGVEPVEVVITNGDHSIVAGHISEARVATELSGYIRIAVRKKWQPGPLTLKPGWIWSNDGVRWTHSFDEPITDVDGALKSCGVSVVNHHLNFIPPEWHGQPVKHQIH